jgi:UDP-N-acetylglucosamine diphosphorylase/glucosamine-1-phosphate N-acetyltransferase
MRIAIFEDVGADDLAPLTLTRPVFDLLCGTQSNLSRLHNVFSPAELGLVVRPNQAAVCRERFVGTPINDFEWIRSAPIVLINGRWMPPADFDATLIQAPCVGTVGGGVAFAAVPPAQMDDFTATTLDDIVEEWRHTLPTIEVGGRVIRRPWDLVDANAQQIETDLSRWSRDGFQSLSSSVSLLGKPERLWVSTDASIEPHVVADTRNGPVVIDAGAVISAFTRLEGPCYIGRRSQVFGAKIRAGTSIGPNCRVGGEVEASIMHGHSNKYHEGFLGHSYVGEWVNIGAGAQTSDLRHDYGEVLVTIDGLRVPTGSSKIGSFIGDHAKIGLGCLLNSGTMLGAFAGVLPAGKLLPKNVPSFSAVLHGEVAIHDDPEMLFATAEEVMRRRGVVLSDALLSLYRSVFDKTAFQRQQAIRQADARRLRRSA